MKLFELTQKRNMQQVDPAARQFVAKMIMKEVDRIAQEKNISHELAYEMFSKGLYGADREITI